MKIERFYSRIARLEVEEFLGLARLLKVDVWTKDGEATGEASLRPFDQVLVEVGQSYISLNRERRRQIDKILKEATKNKDSTKHVL